VKPSLVFLSSHWSVSICLSVVLLATIPTRAQTTIATAGLAYEEGLEAYLAGSYEEAVESFLAAEASGMTSGELLYNTGNAYFRMNNLGKAVLYYERARSLTPTDELLIHSSRIARRKTMNRFGQIPRPFWSKYWNAVVARLGPTWMFFVGLCFYFTAVAFLGFRIWTNSRNDWIRRGFALCLLAALPLMVASFKASLDQAGRRTAVVLQTRVDLRDNPSEVGPVEATVFEGLIVDIVDRSEDWVEIRLPDGATGWVENTTIEEV
jgi:tetratricopeptide (TPR) repeat protein